MKNLKNAIRVSVLVVMFAALILVGNVFATNEDAHLNLMLKVPTTSLSSGQTVDVTVKITNTDIAAFKMAGLQVMLDYDDTAFSVNSVSSFVDDETSTVVYNNDNGVFKFVCVKNEFTENTGYTTIGTNGNLFTVKFQAKKAITDTSALFEKDDLSFIMGSTLADEIDNSRAIYGGSAEEIAELLLNSNFEITANTRIGNIIIVPTVKDANQATSKNAFSEEFSDTVEITAKNGIMGTGSSVTYNGKTVNVVSKGDVDGDGCMTVFDSTRVLKKNASLETFDDVKDFAGDVDKSGSATNDDAQTILDQITGIVPIQ